MATPYTVGDTSPALTGVVSADITGATLAVNVARPDASVFTHAGTVVSGPAGTWSMALVTGDLTLSGDYRVEVQVTFANLKIQTFAYDLDDQYNSFPVRDQIG